MKIETFIDNKIKEGKEKHKNVAKHRRNQLQIIKGQKFYSGYIAALHEVKEELEKRRKSKK